jgi:heat-inducible transcriptional repressor
LRAEIQEAEIGDPTLALLHVADSALDGPDTPEDAVVVEGRTHLLVGDDGVGDMGPVLSALEDKRLLLGLLEGMEGVPGQEPKVMFGEEAEINALRQCTVVAASYGLAENRMGTVAIIGPVRMDYARIVPWVGCTAEAISGILVKQHVAA